MFYLIIAVLLVLYYFFMASESVKNTLGIIGKVGLISLVLVLAGMGFMALLHAPAEFYVGLVMILVAIMSLRDILRLSVLPKSQTQIKLAAYIKSKFNN